MKKLIEKLFGKKRDLGDVLLEGYLEWRDVYGKELKEDGGVWVDDEMIELYIENVRESLWYEEERLEERVKELG